MTIMVQLGNASFLVAVFGNCQISQLDVRKLKYISLTATALPTEPWLYRFFRYKL
jgi:hypothetical protein